MLYYSLWYFIIYSLFGWCTEVVYATTKTGKFTNRGFLSGPVCPIYGFGALLVIHLLTPVNDNVLLLFLGSLILTTLLEGVVGFVLEKLFKTTWWDYSDEPFNIMGYVCLRFSIYWGLGCLLVMRIFHPMIIDFVDWIPMFIGNILTFVLLLYMVFDFIYSVSVILKFNHHLERLEELSKDMKVFANIVGNMISEATMDAMEIKEDLEEYEEKLKKTRKEYNDLLNHKLSQNRFIKSFPTLKSLNHNEALVDIKNNLEKIRKERRANK